MRIPKQSNVKTLSEWLEVATNKLEETAKERIRKEIEAHFAEAVEAYREEGRSKSDAGAVALRDLGDPRSAARKFRRTHFTIRDVKLLKSSEEDWRSIQMLVMSYVSFLTAVAIGRAFHYPLWFLAIVISGLWILPTWCFLGARRDIANARRLLLLVQTVMYFTWWILTLSFLNIGPWSYLVFGAIYLPRALDYLRLWNKMGRIAKDVRENPPLDAAQA